MNKRDAKPEWHGGDKSAAITRAKRIGGQVIRSWPPESNAGNGQFGYWSDAKATLIRAGESVVWPKENN